MTRARRRWPALLPLLLLAAPAAAQAPDDRPSHVHVPLAPGSDPARLFQERIRQSQMRTDLEGLLRQLGRSGAGSDPRELLEQLRRTNPAAAKMAEELARGLRSGDPAARERVQGLLNGAFRDNPDLARRGLNPDFLQRQIERMARSNPPPGDRPGAAPPRPESRDNPRPAEAPPRAEQPPPAAERPPADPAEQESRREWSQRLAEWAERFPQDRLAGLRDSPAVQNLLHGLTEASARAWRNGGGEGLDAQLARWESRFRSARDWLPQHWPEGLNLHLPDLSGLPHPDVHLPDFNGPSLAPPSSAPSFGAPSINAGGMATVVLYTVAATVVMAVLWRLRKLQLSPEAAARRAFGSWPLDPDAVTTREELIRAFEHLSLRRYGEPARSWHHRAIADRLGGTEEERRAAAERLAALYEQARYAPPAGGSPEPDWTAARRPLTLLSGTGT